MLNTFEDCPLKFDYIFNEHLDVSTDAGSTCIGKTLHSLLNYFFKGDDISKMIPLLDKEQNSELKLLWNNFLNFNINSVFASELTFNVILNSETILTGRVDAIRKKNDIVEILDWKTGKSGSIIPESDYQTIVYLYSLYNLFFENGQITKPENLLMSYFFLKENTYYSVCFSNVKLEKYKNSLSVLTDKIQKYKTNSSYKRKLIEKIDADKCIKCSFKIFCKRTS